MPEGTLAFEGRPLGFKRRFSIRYSIELFAFGVFLIFMGIFMAGGNLGTLGIFLAAAAGLFAGGVGLAYVAWRESGTRIIEVGDRSIRLIMNGRLEWTVPLSDIRAIGTPDTDWGVTGGGGTGPGTMLNTGFWLKTEKKRYGLNVYNHIQEVDTLMEAYTVLASRLGPTVDKQDNSGWLEGVQGTGGEIAVERAQVEEGTWQESSRPNFSLKWIVSSGVLMLVLGIILTPVIAGTDDDDFFWVFMIGIGIMITAMGIVMHLRTPGALRFTKTGLALRYPLGKTREYQWGELARCSPGYTTDTIIIVPRDTWGQINGFFKREVVRAAVLRHRASRTYTGRGKVDLPYPTELEEF